VFPALFLGAAAGLMASHLPGFALTPAVGVGMGAAIAAVLVLPLSAVILATLLTAGSGDGASPVIIVGVIVAYLTTRVLSGPKAPEPAEADGPDAGAAPAAPALSGTSAGARV
jgi:chloride channel protein, CIC family